MFYEIMKAVVEDLRETHRFDEVTHQIWQAHSSGTLDDAEAQSLAERIHERRRAIQDNFRNASFQTVSHVLALSHRKLFTARRIPVSPDQQASRDRRRLMAYSGPMPPALAAHFTPGELAVLRIVANEVIDKNVCDLCVDAIAGRAGVCRRLAQKALRLAQSKAMLSIEERRNKGQKNSTNLVCITDLAWQAWTRRARKRKAGATAAASEETAIGCKSIHPTNNQDKTESKNSTKPLINMEKRCHKAPSSKPCKKARKKRRRRHPVQTLSDRTGLRAPVLKTGRKRPPT